MGRGVEVPVVTPPLLSPPSTFFISPDIKNRAQEEYHVTRIQQNNAIEDCEAHYDKMYKTYMQAR